MLIVDANKLIRVFVVSSALVISNTAAFAQTPKPTPPANPTQRDATKPPGSEQNPTTPPETRPNTQNPAAPPSSQQAPPNAPPGSNVPQTPTAPGTQPTPTTS